MSAFEKLAYLFFFFGLDLGTDLESVCKDDDEVEEADDGFWAFNRVAAIIDAFVRWLPEAANVMPKADA